MSARRTCREMSGWVKAIAQAKNIFVLSVRVYKMQKPFES